MAPLPQEGKLRISNSQSDGLSGEEVVISGISGQFAISNNVMEFMENLYNKVDMVPKHDPVFEHADLSHYKGQISDLEKFDAQFFKVTPAQAELLDPISRKLMEHAYAALYDAGVNPLQCKGKKIGVFAAAYNIESSKLITCNKIKNHFIISGSAKAMHSNRISYWLDVKGPSFTFDSAAGSIIALEYAVNCIKSGICDAAIVGGCELPHDPILRINMRNAGIFSLDGKTRCFDKHGDGTATSEAVGVFFLQKAKDAKRIYAEICGAGVEYGLKDGEKFEQNRDPKRIVEFLKSVYSKSGLVPNKVEYVEAHGAAHPEIDANELEAIAQVFAEEKSVLVGCVKSNMGDTQPVSALCSITKLCLAYHKGELPGNLHYNDPLDIPVLNSGKVEVLRNNKGFNRGTTAVNSFSHTGTNGHIVLKGHYKPKDFNRYKIEIPRLVLVSGRHEKALEKTFGILKNQPMDPEFIGMLNDIHQMEIPGFTYRGFTILDRDTNTGETICLSKSTNLNQEAAPPLWLLYSGMGSQWAGMGTELMRIPIFAAAIEKCHKILSPKGVDVVKIITSPDKTIFDNVLNCFIGIAAVQIGLTNILKEIGIVADNIIGHSVGELGCSYYDGCLTDEEMILIAHTRGLVSIQTKLIKGSMAAVGLGYTDMLPLCPPSIEIACRNSPTVCTISGPADVMKTFVADLTAKGIFAKEVPCGNIAYHSRYIKDAGPEFLKRLKQIIKKPIRRSKNWISTSWPDNKRDGEEAEMCSAEYHTNNLLSPVYFEEAAKLIPENAVVVEIAPHGLMQAILKRSHPKCTHVALTRRDHSNPLRYLFEAFGKLYEMGYNLKVNAMYAKIEYPVSTETFPLSHLVEWSHEKDWLVPLITKKLDKRTTAIRKIAISIEDDDFKFLAGYRREGKLVVPEAAILYYVWETLAMYKEVCYTEVSVAFSDVHFLEEVIFDLEDAVHLRISICKGNNYFEVTRSDVIIASGYIIPLNPKSQNDLILNSSIGVSSTEENNKELYFNSEDVYKTLKLKGYCLKKDFQMIHSSHQSGFTKIKMSNNWITFLDSLIQFNVLIRDYDGISLPKIIKSLTINMMHHKNKIREMDDENCLLTACVDKFSGVTTCGGVKIKHIIFKDKPIYETFPDILETRTFVQSQKSSKIKEFKLVNAKPGNIDGMQWEEVENGVNIDSPVQVYYAAPSMKDVQNAAGIGETQVKYGMDFSGIDRRGNRVMGLVAGGALASTVEPDNDLLWPVPQHWSLEEGATVVLPYVHAYYCLFIRGSIQAGQTVLVIGGAGALGQAVISICLSLNCNVYTTVRDIFKKRLLMRIFPNLNESHIIGFSRDPSFYDMFVYNSKNKLSNYVINCSTGLIREMAMKCVAPWGCFLDVTDYDMRQNSNFGMSYLNVDKTYATVDLSQLFKPENIKDKKFLHKMISEGIASGIVRPLSHVVYSAIDVRKAFRLISQSKHIGRALIKIREDQGLTTILEGICNKRAATSLPALMIQAELENGDVDENLSKVQPTTAESIFRAMDRSLKQNRSYDFAYNKTMNENGLLEKVSKILGIDMDTFDGDVCVKDLICNDVITEELKFAFMENYKFEISSVNIKEMTVNSLRNLCSAKKEARTKFEDGLSAFYNFVDYDVHKATEVFEPMPTLLSSAEVKEDLHAKAINIMLIPGFEGHHHIYKSICESLKIRATVLQLGPDLSTESIQHTALSLKKLIKKRFELKPKFYLLGYLFGVNVALEVAALLEKDGYVGVVYCLDSSPDALCAQLDAYLGPLSEEQLQNAVIEHMYHLMNGQKYYSFKEKIEKANNWDEKVAICIEKLKKYGTMSHEYKKDIIMSFYKRICLAKSYKPELKLESDIVLLKGISHPKSVRLDDDYGLSKYTKNQVKVFNINTDVAVAPYDRNVPNIVNKFLEPALIEEFKTKSLCERYTFNVDN